MGALGYGARALNAMAPIPTKASNTRARSAASAGASAGTSNVVGPSVRVRGRVTGDGDIRVEGRIEGDVQVSGALVVDARGTVTGNAQASAVEIEGKLVGDVTADGAVAIKGGAHVEGNITGSEISLDEGASFAGRIDASFELPDGLDDVSAAPVAVRGRR